MLIPLRILWVSEVVPDPNSGAGGTELQFVKQLRLLGHQVTTIWEDQIARRIRHGNLHYALELPRSYCRVIASEMKRGDFDVVTVNLGQSYYTGQMLRRQHFPGAFVVRSHGLDDHLEHVRKGQLARSGSSTVRGVFGAVLQKILASHMRKAADVCDGYVVSNSLDANWLAQKHGMPQQKIAVIPQAPADAFCSKERSPFSEERLRRLLYVANFHSLKSPQTVASVATRLLHSDPTLQLTWICHESDHGKVRELTKEINPSQLQLGGWRSQEELVQVFDQHGVFLYPSRFDGFGKIFLEAMSRGLCVAGAPAGGMVDIIQHGINGALCQPEAVDEIVAVVQNWIATPAVARQISENAVATARRYTWELAGSKLSDFFSRRLASKTGLKTV